MTKEPTATTPAAPRAEYFVYRVHEHLVSLIKRARLNLASANRFDRRRRIDNINAK